MELHYYFLEIVQGVIRERKNGAVYENIPGVEEMERCIKRMKRQFPSETFPEETFEELTRSNEDKNELWTPPIKEYGKRVIKIQIDERNKVFVGNGIAYMEKTKSERGVMLIGDNHTKKENDVFGKLNLET